MQHDALSKPASAAAATRLAFSIEETATLLGVGRHTAYEGARRGDIPTIRIGRRLLVPKVALERLLADAATKAA